GENFFGKQTLQEDRLVAPWGCGKPCSCAGLSAWLGDLSRQGEWRGSRLGKPAVTTEIETAAEKRLMIDARGKQMIEIGAQWLAQGLEGVGKEKELLAATPCQTVHHELELQRGKLPVQRVERFVNPVRSVRRIEGVRIGPPEDVLSQVGRYHLA